MQPDIKAHADVSKEGIAECRRSDDEKPCEEHVGFAPCSHIGHEHRHSKEEQRRSEITRDDKHQHGESPEHNERCNKAHGRQVEKEEAACGECQHREVIREICREKKDEQNLAELRGLHGKRSEREPILIAADAYTKDEWKQQDKRCQEAKHVWIIEHTPQAFPEQHDKHPKDDADTSPAQLRHEEFRLEPSNLHESDGKKDVRKREGNAVESAPIYEHIACRAHTDEKRKPRQICKLHTPVRHPARRACPLL